MEDSATQLHMNAQNNDDVSHHEMAWEEFLEKCHKKLKNSM